ncbi:hypothetical protein CEXT_46391 [Caerostris extrusa]|uniref:Uncharacterized protein n=1 Tax=Caerostris extrusa TaxID=172846 RepID=A0AAV4SR02_CAEEX|nr:hypothetical protein CEXT_46391 [Caerostris extrusa]
MVKGHTQKNRMKEEGGRVEEKKIQSAHLQERKMKEKKNLEHKRFSSPSCNDACSSVVVHPPPLALNRYYILKVEFRRESEKGVARGWQSLRGTKKQMDTKNRQFLQG